MSSSRAHNPHEAQIEVDGHPLRLRNLDKVLYPATNTTKAEVIKYYARTASALLPLLADRAVSRFRWPDGVGAAPFVEKSVPAGTPSWVRTVELEAPGSSKDRDRITYPVVDSLATLTWLANLAALELHVPQWRVGTRGGAHHPDRLVIDLDPGDPASLPQCAEVALLVRERLTADGLVCLPVTSGSKGLQLYAPLSGLQSSEIVSAYAKILADSLAGQYRHLVVSSMAKRLRGGKVLLDWSQNHQAKTTICPYSLRGRERPTAAAPRTWAEIEDAGTLTQLHHREVVQRLDEHRHLTQALLTPGPLLPTH